MNLNALRLFRLVAHNGSFSRASQSANISQPAVSKAVADLEASLGVQLLDRTRKPVSMTDASRRLLVHADTIFLAERAAEQEADFLRAGPRQHLRIAASTTIATYMLPPYVDRFIRAHPSADLVVTTGNLHAVASALMAGQAEIALVEGLLGGFEHFVTVPWRRQRLTLVVAADHPLASHPGPITRDELAEHTFIHREAGSSTMGFVGDMLAGVPDTAGHRIEVGNDETVRELVAHGLGFALIQADVVADALQSGRLIALAQAAGDPIRSTLEIRLTDDHPSALASDFRTILHRAECQAPD